MGDLGEKLAAIAAFLVAQLRALIAMPIDPDQRIYLPYLLTSLVFAVGVYVIGLRAAKERGDGARPSLWRFLFPKEVWSHPSAWLDVRYFFFHQVVRLSIYGAFLTVMTAYAFGATAWLLSAILGPGAAGETETTWLVDAAFVAVGVLGTDLVAYAIHRLQHQVPLLWEFHKVHHSATVLHPLTNYREHPLDNLAYAAGSGLLVGSLAALAHQVLGYVPHGPRILGVGAAMVAFNALGYNLRHSHVWLRWPGRLGMVFGCPAHHQIHHSANPDHVQKNFAFMFPVWDVLFKTFHLPETNEGIALGLGNGEEAEYRSCLGLYFVPLKKAYRLALRRRAGPTSPER